MARTSTYLNFAGTTEAAFHFYKSVFGTEFADPFMYMRDIPPSPHNPPLTEAEQGLVMHVSLPITGGHILNGTDAVDSMGHHLTVGNNFNLNVEPDTRTETDRVFNALAEGGKVTMPLQEMFWGAYYGALTDRYGIQWMFNCTSKT
jgi:PhnB protein